MHCMYRPISAKQKENYFKCICCARAIGILQVLIHVNALKCE
jgi:hypothetical protein